MHIAMLSLLNTVLFRYYEMILQSDGNIVMANLKCLSTSSNEKSTNILDGVWIYVRKKYMDHLIKVNSRSLSKFLPI